MKPRAQKKGTELVPAVASDVMDAPRSTALQAIIIGKSMTEAAREAGNVTYRARQFPYAVERPVLDAILHQIGELGASAEAVQVEIATVDAGEPAGYTRGPDFVQPMVLGAPAWVTTLPSAPDGSGS